MSESTPPSSRSKGYSESVDADTPRAFAPGLARKKPKPDPYGEFSFLEPTDSKATGTWTTIDNDTNMRQWDPRFEKEQAMRSQGQSSSRASVASKDLTSTKPSHDIGSIVSFENPELDVDPEVRERFVDSRKVLHDNRHLSEFEKRNKRILQQDFRKPIVNMIGGKKVNVVQPKIDDRAEYRDRSGNYVDGVDRGRMKKRYEDEWSKRLQARDDEMVALSKIKREWDVLPPAEKERRIEKREVNKGLVSLLGAGIGPSANSDIFDYEEIPDVYLRPANSGRVFDWVTKQSSSSVPSTPDDQNYSGGFESASHTTTSNRDSSDKRHHSHQPRVFPNYHPPHLSGTNATPTGPRNWQGHRLNDYTRKRPLSSPSHQPDYRKAFKKFKLGDSSRENSERSSSQSTERTSPVRASRYREEGPPSILSSIPSTDATPSTGQSSSVATDSTATVVDILGPELAAPNDIKDRVDHGFEDNEGGLDFFDSLRPACTKTGRVLAVTLHEPVKYSTSAIADRLFGGTIQEIQYFPAERMALVVFVFPSEAAAVIRHVGNARENDKHALVRLQIHVEWYHGLEIKAIFPAQPNLLASVLAEKASRVLLVHGIAVATTTAMFAHDMKTRFYDKLLVKVAIVRPTKRYVQARDGNMGILEFAGVKDAIEIMNRFKLEQVQEYESATVEFLADSCAKAPVRMPYCDCLHCKSLALRH